MESRQLTSQQQQKNHSEYISELLAGHALSGCDTVACLFGIGKGTIIKSSREATS